MSRTSSTTRSQNHSISPNPRLRIPLFQLKTSTSRIQSQISILLLLDSGLPFELLRFPSKSTHSISIIGEESFKSSPDDRLLPSLELKSLKGEVLETINGTHAIENYLESELRSSEDQLELDHLERALMNSLIFECDSFLLEKLYPLGNDKALNFSQFFNKEILPFLTHLERLLSSSTFPFSKLSPINNSPLNLMTLHVHLLLCHLFEIFPSQTSKWLGKTSDHSGGFGLGFSHLYLIWKQVENRNSVNRFQSDTLDSNKGLGMVLREDEICRESHWFDGGKEVWKTEVRERCRREEDE